MNKQLLHQHIGAYKDWIQSNPSEYAENKKSIAKRVADYQNWTRAKMQESTDDELRVFFARLWAMRMWGDKLTKAGEIIRVNILARESLREEIAKLLHGEKSLEIRWDEFRKSQIKGMGSAMMSELLLYMHPDECVPWNRVTRDAFAVLGVSSMPRYEYQTNGKVYQGLCQTAQKIRDAMPEALAPIRSAKHDMLDVNEFVWWIADKKTQPDARIEVTDITGKEDFVHNEVRDKIAEIGKYLGYQSHPERKVADGAVVDVVWEAAIGNMGRLSYVFEVQTKGSIDSLILNLIRAIDNPVVQGVVAVSDEAQLEKIRKEVKGTPLAGRLKEWNYEEVLQVHSKLQEVSESVNRIGLVPDGL